MDPFLKAMETVAALARQGEAPALNSFSVMARIASLPDGEESDAFPLGLFLGIGASAVAAAAIVAAVAFPAWSEIMHPLADQARLPGIGTFLR